MYTYIHIYIYTYIHIFIHGGGTMEEDAEDADQATLRLKV